MVAELVLAAVVVAVAGVLAVVADLTLGVFLRQACVRSRPVPRSLDGEAAHARTITTEATAQAPMISSTVKSQISRRFLDRIVAQLSGRLRTLMSRRRSAVDDDRYGLELLQTCGCGWPLVQCAGRAGCVTAIRSLNTQQGHVPLQVLR